MAPPTHPSSTESAPFKKEKLPLIFPKRTQVQDQIVSLEETKLSKLR